MSRTVWMQHQIPVAGSPLWELFHENSKLHPYQEFPSDAVVLSVMREMYESLSAPNLVPIPLPKPILKLNVDLGTAIQTRESARDLRSGPLTMQDLSTMLHAGYGITRTNHDTDFPRPFRTVPSGGGLYPLEILVHSTNISDGPSGLLHYDPMEHALRKVDEDRSEDISRALVDPDCAARSSAIFFFTALFERSVFKYRNRGYRFVLIEAGHVCQNINLVAAALGRKMLNLGGFMDREIDEILGLNGIGHSIIYMSALSGVRE
jgi:SagB-type dehydrogenase family enzyme